MSSEALEAFNKLVRLDVLRLIYNRYPLLTAQSHLLESMSQKDCRISPNELRQILDYWEDHRCVEIKNDRTKITPVGIDWIETEANQISSVQALQFRQLRLRILQALNALQGRALPERIITLFLKDELDIDRGPEAVLRACHYLSDRGLIQQIGTESIWKIRAPGIDYLEGNGENISGISRPIRL